MDAALAGSREGGPTFSLGNRLLRAIWIAVWTGFAAWTPSAFFAWRRFLLRCFGAQVAVTSRVYPGCRIWHPANLKMGEFACLGPRVRCYNIAIVELRAYALVSQGAHLCTGTHDIDDPAFQLKARPITIGENAWVAAESFVGPGVNIGDGAVLGARGVAFVHLEPWVVYSGNPARQLRSRRPIASSTCPTR